MTTARDVPVQTPRFGFALLLLAAACGAESPPGSEAAFVDVLPSMPPGPLPPPTAPPVEPPPLAGAGGSNAVAGSGGTAGTWPPLPPVDSGVEPSPDAGAQDAAAPELALCQVAEIPDALRQSYDLDPFYTRFADAGGIPIVSSDSPVDEALTRACRIVLDMTSTRPDVVEALLDQKIRFIMMGADEKTVDTPDFAYLGDIDWRARGLGGVPAGLCAEENVMCDTAADRWRGESICVHEYSHTIQMAAWSVVDPTFDARLEAAFDAATGAGLFADTYAGSQPAEYLAEGVQDWYDTNLQSANPNGVHNHVNTRVELETYDPTLYDLLAEFLPATPGHEDCYLY